MYAFEPSGVNVMLSGSAQAFDRLDRLQRLHVDDGDRVAFRIALVVPAAVRREREMLGREAHRDLRDELERAAVDDVRHVRALAARDDVAAVRRHHHHVRIDVVAEEGAAQDLLGLDVHERDVVRVAVHDHHDRRSDRSR